MPYTETEIKEKLLQDDETGLRQLFEVYYTPLCVYALKYIDSFEKAEDIVQEVFINLWEKKRVENITGSLRNYLLKSVKNNTLNVLRKSNRYQCESLDEQIDIEDLEDEEPIELETRKKLLYNEIDALSPQAKAIFECIVFGNYKYKEVAEEMDISVNTVKTTFARALKKLRSSLDLVVLVMMS